MLKCWMVFGINPWCTESGSQGHRTTKCLQVLLGKALQEIPLVFIGNPNLTMNENTNNKVTNKKQPGTEIQNKIKTNNSKEIQTNLGQHIKLRRCQEFYRGLRPHSLQGLTDTLIWLTMPTSTTSNKSQKRRTYWNCALYRPPPRYVAMV